MKDGERRERERERERQSLRAYKKPASIDKEYSLS